MILSDNETKVDLLNNEAIAKTIVSLIKDSKEQPISIGIHGDWGAGKSSILEMVENEVKLASSPGKARWKQLSQQHCGYCVPCLIRRAAMHKAFGDDGTVYTETSIYEMQNKNAEGMGIQLRSFQYAIDKIKQDRNRALFYIHKPGPLPQDDEYLRELADTYIRGLLEVDAFIQDNLAQEDENNDL